MNGSCRLIKAALAPNDFSAVRDMLLAVATELGAYGGALWQVQPPPTGSKPTTATLQLTSKIFVLAAGLSDDVVCAFHDVPLESATGKAMLEGHYNVPDISSNPLVGVAGGGFLQKARIKSLASVRVDLDAMTPGAVTLYFQTLGGLSEEAFAEFRHLATQTPLLYRAVRDRVSFRLLEEVNRIIREAERRSSGTEQTMQSVCHCIGDVFQCFESSIYLEDPTAPGSLDLMATTRRSFLRKEHLEPGDDGLTCWVWRSLVPLSIFDLKTFCQADVKGLRWHDAADVANKTPRLLGLGPKDEAPPISFMAVPVVAGDRVIGVLRCCAARQGPYLFAEREVELLGMVAARIGQHLYHSLRQRELDLEVRSWNTFVRLLSEFNRDVQQALAGSSTSHIGILHRALDVLGGAISAAEILEIGVFTQASGTVSIAASRGNVGATGGEQLVETRRRLSAVRVTEDPPRSPAAIVYRTRRLLRLRSVPGQYMPAYDGVRRGLFMPILADGEFLGVVSMQRTADVEFTKQAEAMLELVSHQIGLYLRLALGIRQLTQTYRDLYHQLRSPVFQANKRASVVRGYEADSNFDAVRGLLKKTQRVVANLRLYEQLATGRALEATTEPIALRELVKPLIESADDTQILCKHRKISFQVDRGTFERGTVLRIDMAQFEQAVSNVLDNAGKYSYSNTTVVILAVVDPYNRAILVFRNSGIPIAPDEVKLVSERGWQAERAKGRAGEGSGIGLWIVRNIMLAHRGELVVIPTDKAGVTEIRLVFPST